MGIVTNRKPCSRRVIIFLAALVVVVGFQPGFSDSQAIEQLREAAEQGDAEAQYKLGAMYLREPLPKAKNQNSFTALRLAKEEALKWTRKAADQEHAGAQHNLGHMHRSGWGVPEDDREAVKWFRKAAAQGYASAQTSLGSMYHLGEGVPENDREAVKWFGKAANQGEILGQYFLGTMYYKGEGVPQDYVQAYAWWNLGAAQGAQPAVEGRNSLRQVMTAEQVAEAQKLSAELFERIQSSKTE